MVVDEIIRQPIAGKMRTVRGTHDAISHLHVADHDRLKDSGQRHISILDQAADA
jgi:hypothetical protein